MNNILKRLQKIDGERKRLRNIIIKSIRELSKDSDLHKVCQNAGIPSNLERKLKEGRMTNYSDTSLIAILNAMEERVCQK